MKFQISISFFILLVAILATMECAKKKKKTQNLKENNMAELTQKYFACNMKIQKALTGEDMGNLKSTPPKCPSSEGGKCIIGCMMTEFGVLTNNQINLTTAGELIKKKAGDKSKECMDVLEMCANKVGVQPTECLAGELACNCVIDSATPNKKTQNLKASNMAELTKIYFTCYTKINKSMNEEDMKNLKSTPPKCPTSDGGKCIIGCMMSEFGLLTNNQINLTRAGELIKKKAGDKAKESMAVLEICSKKVGVQPTECLSGELACNCFMDSGIVVQMG